MSNAREQEALTRLSVFAGAFETEAAAAICASPDTEVTNVSPLLEGLMSKSLLMDHAGCNHPERYRLLETVRDYAADQLEQAGLVAESRTAHATFYTVVAERAEAEFTGPRQLEWFERIAVERANLRAALEWSLSSGQSGQALRLASALVLFWRVRGPYAEGRSLLQAALSAGDDQAPRLSAKALWGAGIPGADGR